MSNGTSAASDDDDASSGSSSSMGSSGYSAPRDTVVGLLSQVPSHCSCLYDVFRPDKSADGREVRRLCREQIASATDLFLKFYTEEYTVTYRYLSAEIDKMMKVNMNKLQPLVRAAASPDALEMLQDLDGVLTKIRGLIMRGDCLPGQTWGDVEEGQEEKPGATE